MSTCPTFPQPSDIVGQPFNSYVLKSTIKFAISKKKMLVITGQFGSVKNGPWIPEYIHVDSTLYWLHKEIVTSVRQINNM